MSNEPESVDLAYIGYMLQRLTAEVAALRRDVNVLAAIVQRIGNNQHRLRDELRAGAARD